MNRKWGTDERMELQARLNVGADVFGHGDTDLVGDLGQPFRVTRGKDAGIAGRKMGAQRVPLGDRPYEVFSLWVDVGDRDATDFLPSLGQIDDAQIAELRHEQLREIPERS